MADSNANILVVDDTLQNLQLLIGILGEQGYEVRAAENGQAALMTIAAEVPDLILLDINMPGMTGYEVCEQLKADEQTRDIPVIFISALNEVFDKVKAFAVGGVDYITKPFQVEEVLARVNTHLTIASLRKDLQAQIDELDAYAHTVAHDLKNPLSLIVGYSTLVLQDIPGSVNEKTLGYLTTIQKTGQGMSEIIDSLLLLAKIRQQDEIELQPFKMEDVVDRCLSRLELLITETQAQIIQPDRWPVALGLASWVDEIMANLLSNALKYGGTPPVIQLGGESLPDGRVRYWVRDNGKGLSKEEQAMIFTEFTRLRQHVDLKGHGLGLSVILRIVKRLGGEIDVESSPGNGSVFSFTLSGQDHQRSE